MYNKEFKLIDNWTKEKINENEYWYNDLLIQKKLENPIYWTLYVAWLIDNIINKRNKEWFNISNKSWIIITLYNMGNSKIPHWNPDLWGSLIKLDDKNNLYFWELGFLMHFYLKYYLGK